MNTFANVFGVEDKWSEVARSGEFSLGSDRFTVEDDGVSVETMVVIGLDWIGLK